MKLGLRHLVVWTLCAGIMVPVVSVTDDIVLLAAAVQELASARPPELRSHFQSNPGDSSVVFWVQFEHMDFPTLPVTVPEIGRAGVITCPEPSFFSFYITKTSVRGPPPTFSV